MLDWTRSEISLVAFVDGEGCGSESTLGYAGLIVWFLLMFYLMLGQFVLCEEFFVPSLALLASRLSMPEDVAGATLLAVGSSSPELFTALLGIILYPRENPGPGTNVGSAVFNMCVIIGLTAIASPKPFQLQIFGFMRDSISYFIGTILLVLFYNIVTVHDMDLWEAVLLTLWWVFYVYIVYRKDIITRFLCCCLPDRFLPRTPSEFLTQQLIKAETGSMCIDGLDDDIEESVETQEESIVMRESVSESGPTRNAGAMYDSDFYPDTLTAAADFAPSLPEDDYVNQVVAAGAGAGVTVPLKGSTGSTLRAAGPSKQATNLGPLKEFRSQSLGSNLSEMTAASTNVSLTGAAVKDTLSVPTGGRTMEVETATGGIVTVQRFSHTVDVTKEIYRDTRYSKHLKRDDGWMIRKDPISGGKKYARRPTLREEIAEMEVMEEVLIKPMPINAPRRSSTADTTVQKKGIGLMILKVMTQPWVWLFHYTIPTPDGSFMQNHLYFTLFTIVCWLGLTTFFVVDFAEKIGACIGIPPDLLGVTLLAVGSSLPDCISSVLVARQGKIDMAVSNAFGSNVFDINMCVGFSFVLGSCIHKGKAVYLGDDSTFPLLLGCALLYMAIFWVMLYCTGGVLTKMHGYGLLSMYAVFVVVFTILYIRAEENSESEYDKFGDN